MGLRFHRRIKILPGVRLNLGRKGASVSVGRPGFWRTWHSSGTRRTTVGLPGTGVSWQQVDKPAARRRLAKEASSTPTSAEVSTSAPTVAADSLDLLRRVRDEVQD